jgi:hypothetical protein
VTSNTQREGQTSPNQQLNKKNGKKDNLPPNKAFKRLVLENSSFLKLYRQKNATHVLDRETASSVVHNLDYEQIGR